MTDMEIANLSGYALDLAIAVAAETPPLERERWGTRSLDGWWVAGEEAWLSRKMIGEPCTIERLLDLLESWQQHAAIEDQGRGRGEGRFLVICGGLADAVVAHGPMLVIALARTVLMAAERRNIYAPMLDAKHGGL